MIFKSFAIIVIYDKGLYIIALSRNRIYYENRNSDTEKQNIVVDGVRH